MGNVDIDKHMLTWIFASTLLSIASAALPHRRFEYKLSFKGPHLIQRDGTIPFWDIGGHAIASDESIRVTPSLRSKRGFVWSKNVMSNPHWEVELTFKVSGRGRVGADGLAFWFTEQRGTDGPVFGSNDRWKGLGVFFDSFDNDGQHNNPYVMAMNNDGTMMYDHRSDGSSQQLGGCLRDFRNKPFPVRAKIEYYQKTLTIFFNNGLTDNPNAYELCLRAENVELPRSGYYGVTGATGGLADDHDVLSLLTHSLTPPADGTQSEPQVSEEERKRYEQEFEDYHKKLEDAKDEYRRQHPDAAAEDFDREFYESQDAQELRMIFEGQTFIHETIRQLHQKLDEMMGRQEMTLSQVNMLQRQGAAAGGAGMPPQQGQLPPATAADSIKRFEVDQILNSQNELTRNLKDVRSFVNDVQQKLNVLQQQQQAAGGAGAGYDVKHQQDVKNMLTNLQNDVRIIATKQAQAPACPPAEGNCVTTFYLVILFALQCLLLLGYAVYRSGKEAQAKKFY